MKFKIGQILSHSHGPKKNVFRFRVEALGKDGTPSRLKLSLSKKQQRAAMKNSPVPVIPWKDYGNPRQG